MSDDTIDDSAAPLMEHLIELRARLVKSLIAVAIVFLVAFVFADEIFNFMIGPYVDAVGDTAGAKFIFTALPEYFFVQLRIALFTALFCAFPVIATQIYKFIAPGLYKNERQAFLPFLVATPVLFVMGASLVFFVVLPLAIEFFLSMQQVPIEGQQTSIELLPKVSEYLSLIMTLIFAFGLVFQMPVVISLLARAGLVTSEGLKKKRKYAVVLTFVAAAVLTPPDPISQIGLAVPTLLLYELSIYASRLIERKRLEREAQEAADL